MSNLFFKEWIAEEKSINDFRSGVRSAIRGLWTGNFELFDFVDAMTSAIQRGYRQAWTEGAKQCGIKFDELTPTELAELRRMTNEQIPFLPGFGSDIEDNSRAKGGLLRPHLERGFMWVNRYNEVRQRAGAMACGDKKKKWQLGSTKEHCRSCRGFNGRVYRYSTWLDNNALPQNRNLECNGFRCRCNLIDTDERITPGRFPRSLLG